MHTSDQLSYFLFVLLTLPSLEADSSVLEEASQGLGEDILSITRMWKNLPAKDTWTGKTIRSIALVH